MVDREFAPRLLDAALKGGAREAEVYLRASKSLSVEVKDGQVDTLESSVHMGYGIRVIREGRLGFSYSNDPSEAEAVAARALESSHHTMPDEYLGLPAPSVPASVRTYDEAIASLSEEEAIERALLIERTALGEDRRISKVRKATASFSGGETFVLNSRGLEVRYPSTACAAQVMTIAEEAGESRTGWDYEGSRLLGGVSFEQVGRNAARRALSLLGARKITPLKGAVILDSSIAVEFLGILASALSAESVQKNRSMLRDRLNEQVLSPAVDVRDSGLLDGRLGSRPVDDEGVPVRDKVMIDKGVLRGYLYNTYTARKGKTVSTGNAARGGYAGLPSVGPTNLYLTPAVAASALPFDSLIRHAGRGLYVIETMGMHTANPVNGEFSVGASGIWIEGGTPSYPVKEAVISGSILGLFGNITMVGDDMRFYGNIGAPSLLIEGVDISA
ncbi:MAG TPA: TldD/PmbA family protein [Dissulfurispiraceae bacterium]|nr:TldD/PmbA family protein [Dissulfurispiraceae bacterium]